MRVINLGMHSGDREPRILIGEGVELEIEEAPRVSQDTLTQSDAEPVIML